MNWIGMMILMCALVIPAAADTYDPKTNQVNIDSVVLNGVVYNNVVVTVDKVISVGGSTTLSPTQPQYIGAPVFTAGASPKIQISFNTDMAPTGSAIGNFVQKDAYWAADKRTYVVDITSFQPGGNIIFPSASFKSVTGEVPGQSLIFTFPALTASVGALTYTSTGYGITTGDSSAPKWTGCNVSITIPIGGNTPITFTGWNGVWSNGHQESGTSNFTIDPTVYDSLLWVNNLPFKSGGNAAPVPFTVNYTVTYKVPATGQAGSANVLLACGP